MRSRPLISKSVNLREAVYAYVSSCCSALADKPSLRPANKKTIPHLGAKPEAEGTLGKWRCSACGKRCSVRPTSKEPFMPKKVEPVQGEVALRRPKSVFRTGFASSSRRSSLRALCSW